MLVYVGFGKVTFAVELFRDVADWFVTSQFEGSAFTLDRSNMSLAWCLVGEDPGEKLMVGDGTGEMEGDSEASATFAELLISAISAFLGRPILMAKRK